MKKHTVAVPVDYPVGNVGREVCHATDRDGHGHPRVGCGDPESRRSASADSGYGNALGIDIGSADQVVDASNPVPAFDAGWGVATREPPPSLLPIGAVMYGLDLSHL